LTTEKLNNLKSGQEKQGMRVTRANRYLYSIVWASILASPTEAFFWYPDFNETHGLVFNGDAGTTICNTQTSKTADHTVLEGALDESKNALSQQGEEGNSYTRWLTETYDTEENNKTNESKEVKFGHRSSYVSSKDSCSTRLRLTPSHQSKVGSVWYEKRLPVLTGFDTTFEFQVSDFSKTCSFHVDPSFSLNHHKSCSVHGGDGLAFVIHGDPNGATAIGGDGDELGYGGIRNSIAIEFDMWTNVPSQGSDDIFYDHISIHSGGINPNTSNSSTTLGYWRPYDLADGKIHVVRIRYIPRVDETLFEKMTANKNLLQYIKDNVEGRRLGTLAVYIDEGVDNGTSPILAIPINLSVVLDLPQSLAYAGFTASTGRKWQKQDILKWRWCDAGGCAETSSSLDAQFSK